LVQNVAGTLAGGSGSGAGLLGLSFLALGHTGSTAQDCFRLFRGSVQPVSAALQLGSLLGG
jgi:hypothetical protein